MCSVNLSESIRVILDNECDCSDDQDNAYLYSDECDKYEVSDSIMKLSKQGISYDSQSTY